METTELSLASLEITKLEAILELMFLAARADDAVHAAERTLLREQVRLSTRSQLPADLVENVLNTIEESLSSVGREERLASIRKRLPDARLRKATLALAAQVVLADGALHLDEKEFLLRAAEALEIEPEAAIALLSSAKV